MLIYIHIMSTYDEMFIDSYFLLMTECLFRTTMRPSSLEHCNVGGVLFYMVVYDDNKTHVFDGLAG